MRVSVLSSILLLVLAVFVAGCGGPEDSDAALSAACERQIAEIASEVDESSTPTAKSTKDKLADETLIECAGQEVIIASPDDENVGAREDTTLDAGGDAAMGDDTKADDGSAADDKEAGAGAAATKPAELDPAARDQFSTTCGGCHALSDAGTSGAVGPNLDDTKMTADEIEQQIINGGGAMPPGLLQGEDAKSVAEYVAGAAAQ